MSTPAYGATPTRSEPMAPRPAQQPSSTARASNSSTAAEAATLSESAQPCIGIATRVSPSRHAAATPSLSDPTTTAVGPRPSPADRYGVAPAGSATYAVKPAAPRSARASATDG